MVWSYNAMHHYTNPLYKNVVNDNLVAIRVGSAGLKYRYLFLFGCQTDRTFEPDVPFSISLRLFPSFKRLRYISNTQRPMILVLFQNHPL